MVTVIWWERERILNCLQAVLMCNLTSVGKKVGKSFTHPQKLLQAECKILMATSLTARELKAVQRQLMSSWEQVLN